MSAIGKLGKIDLPRVGECASYIEKLRNLHDAFTRQRDAARRLTAKHAKEEGERRRGELSTEYTE
jgi:hypothetical protein